MRNAPQLAGPWSLLVLSLLGIVAFWPVLHADFLNFDDNLFFGPDNAELCVSDQGEIIPVVSLLELPIRLVLLWTGERIAYLGAVDDGSGPWPSVHLLGSTVVPSSDPGWLILQQRVLGQVGWGMDTRVSEVRVDHEDPRALEDLARSTEPEMRCGVRSRLHSVDGDTVLLDQFDRRCSDLHGCQVEDRTWRHVVGGRTISVTGDGALVGNGTAVPSGSLARLLRPSGQRGSHCRGLRCAASVCRPGRGTRPVEPRRRPACPPGPPD